MCIFALIKVLTGRTGRFGGEVATKDHYLKSRNLNVVEFIDERLSVENVMHR
jgi:hypothetical protein